MFETTQPRLSMNASNTDTQRQAVRARIKACLASSGAMLGKELCDKLSGTPYLAVWQACYSDPEVQLSHFSRYYLRFDITRTDMVRLSPSILRDFLSFTLLSLPGQRESVIERQVELSNLHREISLRKMAIARNVLIDVLSHIPPEDESKLCAFIAGDVAYFLGHSEPREVKGLGEMVNGSDIDIIIAYRGLPDSSVQRIDEQMMQGKYMYMRHPAHRQELDYICKPMKKALSQLDYGNIHQKIASKIVYESLFLAGSVALYGELRDALDVTGTAARIEADFAYGLDDRKDAMRALLRADPQNLDANTASLFYFSQERVEFS